MSGKETKTILISDQYGIKQQNTETTKKVSKIARIGLVGGAVLLSYFAIKRSLRGEWEQAALDGGA